jgi:hypothetical protein
MAGSLDLSGVSSASPRRAQHLPCGAAAGTLATGSPTAFRAFPFGISQRQGRGAFDSELSLPFKTPPVNLRRPSGGRTLLILKPRALRLESLTIAGAAATHNIAR